MMQRHQYHGGYRQARPRQQARSKIRYMKVDPRVLIKKAEGRVNQVFTPLHRFADFNLRSEILANVLAKGYTTPTPIQDQVIPLLMEGRDVIGLASTGTGKTAAFLLPLLHRLSGDPGKRAIIITPTRELAVQIMEEGRVFARGTRCYLAQVIGGVSIERQIRELSRRPNIVVGTPGRIKDLAERRALRLGEYRTIVLDEVDRMLDMGFVRDITEIIRELPRERHSLFFSATMSPKGQEIAQTFLNNPVVVRVAQQRASDNVDQDIVRLNGRNKLETLHELLIRPGFDKVLIFLRTKRGAERLSLALNDRGFKTVAIHGNKSQSQRQRALNSFKRNEVQALLATDVAARGIDIDRVTHVINYELPETYEDYIHRIGRTGRADRTGIALTFVD